MCYDTIEKLINTYQQLIHDHQIPIDMTTREQYRLEGYDAALRSVVYDLRKLIKDCRELNHCKIDYME